MKTTIAKRYSRHDHFFRVLGQTNSDAIESVLLCTILELIASHLKSKRLFKFIVVSFLLHFYSFGRVFFFCFIVGRDLEGIHFAMQFLETCQKRLMGR